MRKFLALCGAALCFSGAAAAQDHSGGSVAPVTSSPETAAASPARYAPSDLYMWQVGVTYEYVRFRFQALGQTVNMHGFNTSLTRFSNDWIGFEGEVGGAFGTKINKQNPRFLFYGAGLRFAYRHASKAEPWVHALVGGAHLLPQTAKGSPNSVAYVFGGGFDVKLNPRLYWRVQGDYLGTQFFSDRQNHVQAKTGFVINF